MIKSSLLRARAAFENFCLEHEIISERVNTNPGVLAYFVPGDNNSKVSRYLAESGRKTALQYKTTNLPAGRLHVLAAGTMSPASMADLAEDVSTCYNDFRSKLSGTLERPMDEETFRHPSRAFKRAGALNQFPASTNDDEPEKSAKGMDEKIDEALEGIATPDDIQPQEGLKSLFSAIKQSGLAQELKKNGVNWHVAEPGKHAVTFSKGDTPILQLTSIDLGDAKKLGEVLSQLTSIAQGKAPQAAQLELDRVKEMASRASDRKGALDDIAQQFAVPKPEDQQPVNIINPQAPAQPQAQAQPEPKPKPERAKI